jgi:hypothetical protein
MSEIVIVICDLYLPPDSAGSTQAGQGASALAGLERIARFGRRRALEADGGWRPWLARALGRGDLADVPPAVIVAQSQALTAPMVSPRPPAPMARTAWLAMPLHLIASLTSVHLDRRSLLRLSSAEAAGFATDFNQTFRDPDPALSLRLHPLSSGEFLLSAPASFEATTTEPARALVAGLEPSLPRGPRATTLKRLGAELEMWLHAHPLNEARRRRGELPVSTLWLWGGGPASAQPSDADTASDAVSPGPVPTSSAQPAPRVITFGGDPYLLALATLSGAATGKLPDSLVVDSEPASRVVLIGEVTPLLHANPQWTVTDAVADIDRRFLSPALATLNDRRVEKVTLIANNLQVQLRRNDRLKFWRPRQPGLTGLIPR